MAAKELVFFYLFALGLSYVSSVTGITPAVSKVTPTVRTGGTTTTRTWVEEFCHECVTFGDACVFHAPTRRCFAFERHQPMNWHQANDWCVTENFTGLARLFTREADQVVRQFLERRNWHYGNSFAYWIAGEFEKRYENWQWSGLDPFPMSYHNWEIKLPGYKAQPDNPTIDSCVDLELRYVDGKTQHYGWYDTRCDHLQFFICELVTI